MTPPTRRWLRKSEGDRRTARRELDAKPPSYDSVCFHCQQAAEKLLKGLLQERGTVIPRTHYLERLIDLLVPTDPSLRPLRQTGHRLTRFAVDYRYPDEWATRRQAKAAWAAAERVRTEVRRCLGLRPRP